MGCWWGQAWELDLPSWQLWSWCVTVTFLRLSRIKFREEAKRLLFKYAEAAKRLIESRWELLSRWEGLLHRSLLSAPSA